MRFRKGDRSPFAHVCEHGTRLPIFTRRKMSEGSAREIAYDARDASGRELLRRESIDESERTISTGYDAIGQVSTQRVRVTGENLRFRAFNYDAIGNLLELTSSDGGSAFLTSDTSDPDRLCRIDHGVPSAGPCNVSHDGAGNVILQPTRNGGRSLSYFPSGSVRAITAGSTTAKFRYDGSGHISQLEISGTSVSDSRHEDRFGPFLRRRVGAGTVIVRDIPGIASRRGKDGPLVFPFADSRGTRFTASSSATGFAQDISYLPYGEATSRGPLPAALDYTSHQWNGGDVLAELGLVHLGARVYDPVVGRFLSRDPVVLTNSASATNPYAFAFNDPINFSDPSGLCGQTTEGQAQPCPPWDEG